MFLIPIRPCKRTLYRRAEKSKVNIDDPRNLPWEFQVTESGRFAEPGDPGFQERWLIFNAPEPEPLQIIFCSELDLRVLAESHTWIMDGTFKVAPKGFAQMYTIHGYGRFNNEAVVAVIALLSGKTQAQYETLFREIRRCIFRQIGGIGALRRILIDFEAAAHNAIRRVYPEVQITGCIFHFGKSLARKMHAEGLQTKYLDREPDHGQPDHPVKKWFGMVKSIALLPEQLVRFGWEVLQFDFENTVRHTVLHPNDLIGLRNFANYVGETYINGNQFPIPIWNHFMNDGPRTTNHVEGYHSGVNRNTCPEMHLLLENFLEGMQKEHLRWR